MPNISFPDTFSDGQTLTHTHLENLKTAITNQVNGNIDNSNVKTAAAVNPSKLSAVGGTDPTNGEYQALRDGDISTDASGAKPDTIEHEIQSLRQAIKEIRGTTHWYEKEPIHPSLESLGKTMLRGYIDGCTLTRNDEDDVTISIGSCMSTGSLGWLNFGTALRKEMNANWEAGTTNGGFPNSLTRAEKWYHVFVIGKTDGTVDAGFDENVDASALLTAASGYTLYRRVGSVLTGADPFAIIAFKQYGDRFTWDAPPQDIDVSAADHSASQTATLSVPRATGVRSLARVNLTYDASGTGGQALSIREDDHTSVVPTHANGWPTMTLNDMTLNHGWHSGGGNPHNAGYVASQGPVEILCNTSGQFFWRTSSSVTSTLTGVTLGWTDCRGRNA